MRVVEVAVGILWADGKVWIQRRKTQDFLKDYWEFPGGKLNPGETPLEALKRELQEEIGILPQRAEPLLVQGYSYPDRELRIHFFLCRLSSRASLPQGHWVAPAQLNRYRLPPANDVVIEEIQSLGPK